MFIPRCAVALLLGASQVIPATAAPPCPEWRHLTSLPVATVQIDARGRMWTNDSNYRVRMWPLRERGWPVAGDQSGWTEFKVPPGYNLAHSVVTPGDELYVICTQRKFEPYTVFRRNVASGTDWEELPIPNAIGILMSLIVDNSGAIWVGGERREIFRLVGDRWVKEVTPAPLHTRQLLATATGTMWAGTRARTDVSILHREAGSWRVCANLVRGRNAAILLADDRRALVRVDRTLYYCSAPPDTGLTKWADVGSTIVAADSLDCAWVVRDGKLWRLRGTDWTDCCDVPFLPVGLQLAGGHLYGLSESGLWVLGVGSGQAAARPPLGLVARRPYWLTDDSMAYGVAVFLLDGRPHLFDPGYEFPDCVVPLRPEDHPADWRALSASLGLGKLDESFQWGERYGIAAAAADLNGDGTEDVFIATMYDGCRVLRNVRDRRLVKWTDEAGVAGRGDNIAEDVDLFDADGDGDLDAYVACMQGRDRLYLNDGAANFREVLALTGIQSHDGSSSAICRDLDGDGDTDVVVATAGRGLLIHENLGPGGGLPRFRTRVSLADTVSGLSLDNLTGADAADFNGDGLLDLVVAGQNRPARFFWNRGGLRFEEDPSMLVGGPDTGHEMGVNCCDVDGDGDLDVLITGRGGSRFFENVGGRLHYRAANGLTGPSAEDASSTGSVLVDADGDGDLDYLEAFIAGPPLYYENANDVRALQVRIEGPPANRSAVGAVARVVDAGTDVEAAPRQEVAGGSGYGSQRTKVLYFPGLSAGRLYDVSVTMPGGRRTVVRGVADHGSVLVSLRAGAIQSWAYRLKLLWLDRWSRAWLLATALATTAVGLLAAGLSRRLGFPLPWYGIVIVPLVAIGGRALFPLDPKGLPVLVSTLAAGLVGTLATALARPRASAPTTALLAELASSLRSFDHNQTPRKVLDRLRLITTNISSRPTTSARVAELLREDLALFGNVVLPEFRFLVEGADSAGLRHQEGRRLVRRVGRLHGRLRAMADAALIGQRGRPLLRELADATEALLRWAGALRHDVDRMISTPLAPFVAQFATDRSAVHQAAIRHDVEAVTVRLPSLEFGRILDALLENSIRACGASRLDFRLSTERSETGRLRLRVQDNGPGISGDLRGRLFEAGVTGSSGGTGYGLFAVRRSLDRYGGRILLEDSAAGASFAIELDIVPA